MRYFAMDVGVLISHFLLAASQADGSRVWWQFAHHRACPDYETLGSHASQHMDQCDESGRIVRTRVMI